MRIAAIARGAPVEAIDTPALVVDLDAMEKNLAAMAAFARELAGVDHLVRDVDVVDAGVGERRCGAPRLPLPARAERRVELALHAHLGVPDRFAVADGDDPRDVAVVGHVRQGPDRVIAAAGSACTSRSASPRRGRGRRSRGGARRR